MRRVASARAAVLDDPGHCLFAEEVESFGTRLGDVVARVAASRRCCMDLGNVLFQQDNAWLADDVWWMTPGGSRLWANWI
jgi:hypothetical protein